jgi:uncharacterized membrane protein
MSTESDQTQHQQKARLGEPRWPMAIAVVATGLLRAALPHELRNGDAAWLFLIIVVGLLANLTSVLIGLISIANADAAIRLVVGIVNVSSFTQNAKVLLASGASIWLSNIIAFALWYWNLDRGGPAARAAGAQIRPALIFPEMLHTQHVEEGWYPTFVDYFHFAFATATAFSPTDVSAVKPWMKLMMMAEEAISLVVAVLVVARAVNILK